MTSPLTNLFLGIGLIFGAIAALMAYLITYNEWIHHYTTKKEPRKIALEAAVFAFLFFFLMSLFTGFILTNYINK